MVAVIPARGGSKRIPRKNVVDLGGRPLMAWTIDAALTSGLFARVIVSTEDPEIAAIATAHGADVPFARDQFYDDHTPVSIVTLYVLEQLRRTCGEEYATVVQLMPNCPFRGAAEISAAVAHFDRSGSAYQISCFKYGWMNPWWAARLDDQSRPRPLFSEMLTRRSQDLEDLYCPTGAVWVARTAALARSRTFYGDGHVWCPLDWRAAVDIDTEEDLEFARALVHMRVATTRAV